MPAIDSVHSFSLTINGVDFYPYVLTGTLRMVDAEGSQIDTLSFDLEDIGWGASPNEWQEVYWLDGATKLFGGYIVDAKPKLSPALDRLQWSIRCESHLTLFQKSPRIRKAYSNATVAAIVADLFTQAGVSGFDVSTYVSTTPTIERFNVSGELLNETLDRLAIQAAGNSGVTWSWRVDANKKLWFGPATVDVGPFDIEDITTCDWTNSFPPSGFPDKSKDATQIRNRITVRGGVAASSVQTDTFTGDGSTILFNTTYKPIRAIVEITVGGTHQRYGWDWVDGWYDENGDGYNVLVDFEAGRLRFPEAVAPGASVAVVVKYHYDVAIETVVSDAASYATYGFWFDYEHEDRSITSLEEATDVGNAFLDEYAFAVVNGSLVVERLGLRAGQYVSINFPFPSVYGGAYTWNYAGYGENRWNGDAMFDASYVLRQVTTEVKKGELVSCTLQFGGRTERLSRAYMKAIRQRTAAYTQPVIPRLVSGVQSVLVYGYDGAVKGQFVAP